MKISAKYETQTYKGIKIDLVNSDWGWYINLSDGYASDYFDSKSSAKNRIAEIKNEIKNQTW